MKKSSRFGSTLGLALGITLSLSAPLIVPFSAPAIAQPQKFSDVPADQPYAPYINRLTDFSPDILKGFPDGTFRPNDPITRAQFAAMLHQAFASGFLNPAQSFVDVPANYWAADAIMAARQDRYLSGYPGNQFKPEQLITRAEMLVSLVSGLGYAGGSPANLAYYRDANEVPTYARSAIANADANRLTNISGFSPGFAIPFRYFPDTLGGPIDPIYRDLNHLYPNLSATRAEAVAFIGQALADLSTVPPVPSLALEWSKDPVATLAAIASQVGVSNNGQRAVTLSEDAQTIQVWDTQTSKSTVKIYRDNGRTHFNSVAISADGLRIAAIAQTAPALTHLEAYMWDAQTGEQLWSASLNYLPGDSDNIVIDGGAKIAFSPDGSTLLTKFNRDFQFKGTGEQIIRLLNSVTGEVVQTLEQKHDVTGRRFNDIQQFEFSPDGTLLAGATYSPGPEGAPAVGVDVNVWKLSDGTRLDTFSYDGGFVWMGFLPDNRVRLFVQKEDSQRQDIWDPQKTEVIRDKIAFPTPSASRADETFPEYLSRDGQYVYINGDPAGGKLANTSTFEVRYLSDQPDKAANFSDNGDYLAIATDQAVQVFAKSNQP